MMQFVPQSMILALLALAFVSFGIPAAAAQPAPAIVGINSWLCPSDYDQISDCEKIGGVVVSIQADGQAVGELTTVANSAVEVEVLPGQSVTVSIVGGAPEGTTLEDAELTFTAAEGHNPVTLVFLEPSGSGAVDSDSDGLSNEEEVAYGTDPAVADTDGDGIQDGGEINVGTDPLVVDTDGDGFLDGEEFDRATDPLDPSSFPVESEPNSIVISAFNCPAGYGGKDLFTDCTTPAAGVDLTVYIPGSEWGETKTTDSGGNVAFSGLGSGRFVVAEDLRTLDATLQRYTMFCFGEPVSPNAPEPRQVVLEDLGNGEYAIDLTSGEEISCSWFNIPAAADAEAPATAEPRPVTALPTTGSGHAHNSGDRLSAALFVGAVAMMLALVIVRRPSTS
ncbi:MAG: thrombospondin type 3 repeat-containing protein [Chloroflexota bacterium]|nr:thrombospondin type 3 repeat-containing protein [Chloroflexota bacterium]